ncbi:hypothetical protein PVP01_0901500 [Plasmodium vivax]|uniref:Uncharacterized protein n=1 Tax=Plasmodium vivax TaxID=5855 RepID=A0A564ZWE2_PLAVI|nr:hypothetical protein PVP01_0901500 [Plasmodium vivax]
MMENKEEFNESCEKRKTVLYELINYKKSEIYIYIYIYNRSLCIQTKTELKKCNYKYLSKELIFKFFRFPLNCLCNKVIMNFIKSVALYQLFILQFAPTIAEGTSREQSQTLTLNGIIENVTQIAKSFWTSIENSLCTICKKIGIHREDTCTPLYVSIPVVVFLFLFVFGIICLICCKCCCKKSCCKKKASEDSNVDYNQFMMGQDGQMYNQMYQGQMMQPQMIPGGMMYPQMYPGQMYYPQMLQQGMQQPEMLQQGMQQLEMQYMEMQQPETEHL